jgi:ferric-dicitrate binding protein FerR (iron transport regulator)
MKRKGGKKVSTAAGGSSRRNALQETTANQSGLSRAALLGAAGAVILAAILAFVWIYPNNAAGTFDLKKWQSQMRHFQVRDGLCCPYHYSQETYLRM